jgi:hypothetical protein
VSEDDLRDAIQRRLETEGAVPTGGRVMEVDYIVMARARVLHDDSTGETVWRPVRSSRVEEDAYLGMAMRLLVDAQDKSRSWG